MIEKIRFLLRGISASVIAEEYLSNLFPIGNKLDKFDKETAIRKNQSKVPVF